jgi:hypothetical protein
MFYNRCEASLRSNYEDFGDSLLGMPFLRSVRTVFDYVQINTHTVSPRLGLASLVDIGTAVKRYDSLYRNRLH